MTWRPKSFDRAGLVRALAILTTLAAPAAPDPAVADPAVADPAVADPAVADPAVADPASEASSSSTETIEIVDRAPPGASSTITREVLERSEQDDLHKVLAGTAGVYVRDEDGYGLRP